MPTFPMLKTGAIAQYPATRRAEASTGVLRFVGGREQRLPRFGSVVRRWQIELEALDARERNELLLFWESTEGRSRSFVFPDPFTGTAAANCRFEQDACRVEIDEAGRASGVLVIRQDT